MNLAKPAKNRSDQPKTNQTTQKPAKSYSNQTKTPIDLENHLTLSGRPFQSFARPEGRWGEGGTKRPKIKVNINRLK